MAESQLNLKTVAILCGFSKVWLHSDITSSCRQSLYEFTSRFNSTLLDCAFFILKVSLYEIAI